MFCKHKHIRTIIASLLLYKAKDMEARTPTKIDDSECGTLAYIGIFIIKYGNSHPSTLQKIKIFCRGHIFLNVLKIVLFISDVQHYIPIRFCKHQEVFTCSKSQHIDIRKHQVEQKLFVGHFRDKLG